MITQQELKRILHYDENTGLFTWIIQPRNSLAIGSVAGRKNTNGHVQIGIKNKVYMAHRLAWLYVHGVWPEQEIDHVNRDRSDNRLLNLRCVTHAQNHWNRSRRSNSSCRFIGVGFNKSASKFIARIQAHGKRHYLGLFNTEEEAYAAYLSAKTNLHVIGQQS